MSTSSARDARAVIAVEKLMNDGAVITSSQFNGEFHVGIGFDASAPADGYGPTFPEALHAAIAAGSKDRRII